MGGGGIGSLPRKRFWPAPLGRDPNRGQMIGDLHGQRDRSL
jgi:hypothetical protein